MANMIANTIRISVAQVSPVYQVEHLWKKICSLVDCFKYADKNPDLLARRFQPRFR